MSALHLAPQQPYSSVHMLHMQPCSPGADSVPYWAPQQLGSSPEELHSLPEPQAPPDLEEPAGSTTNASTSMVFLATGCTVQLQLDDLDLLLELDPTSVLEVSLPEETIILVPEGLQASDHLEQPGILSSSPQGGAVLEMPEDHLLVLQQGPLCEYILESSYQEDPCDEDADSDVLSLWMDPQAGQASEHFASTIMVMSPCAPGHIPEYPSGPSPNAEPYSPRSVWDQDSYLLGPFPSSPLQPLPPSPPSNAQEQCPPSSPRVPCKARKRLFCE
ncbi:Proline-rich protein 23A3 [Lemmus lemmus]